MRIHLAIFTLIALIPVVGNAVVYKSVDAQGNVTFTDEQTPGSEKLDVQPVQGYSTSNVPVPSKPTNDKNQMQDTSEISYQSIEISAPQNEETFQSNEGNLSVEVIVKPSLKKGDKVRAVVDGNVQQESTGTTVSMTGIDRGQHSLQVFIVSADGKVLKSSKSIIFFMQKVGLNSPTVKARNGG